jgi:hypothetical protein
MYSTVPLQTIPYFLGDGQNYKRVTEFTIDLAPTISTPEFLLAIQKDHRRLFHAGQCDDCSGGILATSAWLVDESLLSEIAAGGTAVLKDRDSMVQCQPVSATRFRFQAFRPPPVAGVEF